MHGHEISQLLREGRVVSIDLMAQLHMQTRTVQALNPRRQHSTFQIRNGVDLHGIQAV